LLEIALVSGEVPCFMEKSFHMQRDYCGSS